MKSLSEVQKLTGLTRKQLRHYEGIDLVKPTKKNELGYWLYDDEAIGSLVMVQIFSQAGYRRREIKNILEMNQQELLKELGRLEEKLEAERRRIEGLINYTVVMKSLCSLPTPVMNVMGEFQASQMFAERSFAERMKQELESYAGEKMGEGADCMVLLSLLAMMHRHDPQEAEVQQLVEVLLERQADDIIRMFCEDRDVMPPRDELLADIAENIDGMIADIAEDEEIGRYMEAKGWAFAREAVRVYRQSHMKEKEEAEA